MLSTNIATNAQIEMGRKRMTKDAILRKAANNDLNTLCSGAFCSSGRSRIADPRETATSMIPKTLFSTKAPKMFDGKSDRMVGRMLGVSLTASVATLAVEFAPRII